MKPKRSSESRKPSRRPSSAHKAGLSGGQRRYYSRSRQRSHEAAAQGPLEATAIPDHPLISKAEPVLIDSQAGLNAVVDEIRAAGSFAYDTEFIGELTYFPRLCLIQVATTEKVALIDPLAELDLAGFWAAVADESVETIVHAGVQDLEPVFRHTGRPPRNIFDTQIALGFTDLPYPLSLREAVRLLTGTTLTKGSTFTQWDRRPLSASQLQYAADDVRFLPAVRAAAAERLEALGHGDWARRECAVLSEATPYQFDPLASCRRIRGSRRLSRKRLAALSALVVWREGVARELDIPARSLVKDDSLRTLANKGAKTTAALQKTGILSREIVRDCGEAIVAALAEAAAADPSTLPSLKQPDETGPQRQQIDSLWAVAQACCFGRSVHPGLVAGRADIAEWVLGGKTNAPSKLNQGWRQELLGDLLQKFLAGGVNVSLAWRDDCLRATRSDTDA